MCPEMSAPTDSFANSSGSPRVIPRAQGLRRISSIAELHRWVRAIAKRFVLRRPATAQGDAIAHLIGKAFGRNDGNPAAQPDWPTTLFYRVLDEANRDRKFWLD